MTRGWHNHSYEHALASKGIETTFDVNLDLDNINKRAKNWAEDSKYLIRAYHGSPYEFEEFKIPSESGKKASPYHLYGLSLAPKEEMAEPFSRQLPKEFYEELDDLKSLLREKKDEIKYELNSCEREKLRDYGINVPSSLENPKEVRTLIEHNHFDDAPPDVKDIVNRCARWNEYDELQEWYENEVNDLKDEYSNGKIYEVLVKANNIIEVEGKDVGFQGHREELVNELNEDEILLINNASTGGYIGDEIITKNPSNLMIVDEIKGELIEDD